MITTTYKCDNCGHEQPTKEQMWEVVVYCTHMNSSPIKREFNWVPSSSPMWCRKCVDKLGLLGNWKPEEIFPVQTAPTLEDKIRAIIQEEIDDARY